jgi:hypothetical protein
MGITVVGCGAAEGGCGWKDCRGVAAQVELI